MEKEDLNLQINIEITKKGHRANLKYKVKKINYFTKGEFDLSTRINISKNLQAA